MKVTPHALPLLAALLTTARAEVQEVATPWYPNAAQTCRHAIAGVLGIAPGIDEALAELGGTQADASATAADVPAPGETEGDSVATCENGLFFDASEPKVVRLVYLDNVRLDDSRLKLRAAHRLYLQLPRNEAEGRAESDVQDKEAADDGQEQAAPATEPEEAAKAEPPATPLFVSTYDAMVDTAANRMLFTAGPGVEELRFEQGGNLLVIRSTADKPARLLADEFGNMLMEGAHISMRWVDAQGQPGSLESEGGLAFYHGASHCLVMEGPVVAEQAPGSRLEADGRLCLGFRMAEGAEPARGDSFMGQFTSLRFEGIEAASTEAGKRVLLRDGERGLALLGDSLRYNGSTGEVELSGKDCTLDYGANSLRTQGRIYLAEDGSIDITGERIEGSYERPSQAQPGSMVQGCMSAQGGFHFDAAMGTITTRAFCARDAEADFSCTGAVKLTLAPLPEDKLRALPPREKMGMLNLAIARYGEVSTAHAEGTVRAHGYTPGNEATPDSSLAASSIEADLIRGTMLLTGAGEPASLLYRGYALSGTASEGEDARVQLLPNGDIEARGAQIDAALPGRKGLTTLRCAESATLRRESRQLALGPRVHIEAPEGIITANGPLTAVLAAADKPARAASPRYPHLAYDFSGLESAETQQGATVRTEQGAMQCAQRLAITMEPGGARAGELGGIRHAVAEGKVAVAARDGQGRLMRAFGDRLVIDGTTGDKVLTGSTVVLEDANNRHTASGGGASVKLDRHNNARISGARHETTASDIRKQADKQKSQQPKKR